MLISDLYQETISSISANKARSALTILGVVIGIGSVIAMVSIGQGAQKSIESSIESIGSNLLQISPGMQRSAGQGMVAMGRGSAQTLTYQDAKDIKEQVYSIKAISPELSQRYQVSSKTKNTNTQVVGVVSDYFSVRNLQMSLGDFLSDQDLDSLSRVAVIGANILEDLFEVDYNPIGERIRINNFDFRIVGLIESKGGGVFGSQDDMIFVPLTTAQTYLSRVSYVSSISVQIDEKNNIKKAEEEITNILLSNHKITDPAQADFQIVNQADIIETATETTKTFTILLAAIAGISLLVGGIGIMNMMLTSVTERTREIGLRKAIGAKKEEISNQFLAESIFLTLIGGFLGIVLGWFLSYLISNFANMATEISISSIILAFGVSVLIGIIFGYYPARRASNFNPIDALRYE